MNAEKYLESLNIFGIKPGLERIKNLCEKLGNPQNNYKTIHVTGTNGKGSVSAMLAEMIKIEGFNVGLFTSPHLESYRERFKINGENISEKDFSDEIERIKDLNLPATQFEVLTAAAFDFFARKKVDVAVVEVGLGGLFDSTNIIIPDISVITNVAEDHTNILGDLKNIALNKAGIIKPKVPVVTGATGLPLEIIREIAEKNDSPVFEVMKPVENVRINLAGEFQKFNAAIAIQTAKLFHLTERAIFEGLERVSHPGRFEIFETDSGKIIIDGAHNPNGAAALRQSLDKFFPKGKRIFVFGALKDKNIDEMIRILFRKNDFVIVTPPNSERAATVDFLCEKLKSGGIDCTGIEDKHKAVETLKNLDGSVKVIAGSLYLIGSIRNMI